MTVISFHYISDNYIDYLRAIDPRVMANKKESRPYVVLGLTINNLEYYIPLSSPKYDATGFKRPLLYKKLYYLMDRQKADGTTEHLGSLLFGNMIPVPLTEVNYIDFKELFRTDPDYAVLLTKQFDLIKQNLETIIDQANQVYQMSQAVRLLDQLNHIQGRICRETCDFINLEVAKERFEQLS